MNRTPLVRTLSAFALKPTLTALACAMVLSMGWPLPAAQNPNPAIAPPQARPYGKTYGEWVVEWWQWALRIPADRNPLTDVTGAFAGENQSGPVWFVAGTFGSSVERSSTVPAGKSLFVPVYNWIFGAGAFDCDPSVPGVPCDIPVLQAIAAHNTEAADVLEVCIDDIPVEDVRAYRAASPRPFSITYPENSVTGLPAGTYFPQVADGYWLMLAPLAKGQHTIRIHVRAPETSNGPVEYETITHLNVQ
jgi:hypothetical protein